jgi:hypothetical protein
MIILPDLKDQYQTVFDFGCSITNYRWVTWSDLIAKGVGATKFIKTSQPGAGLRYIYQQLKYVSQNYKFTDSDLVLICLPTLDRKDVCLNSDYTLHNMGSWSCQGSIDFSPQSSPATCMSQGHHGEPRIGIFDMFMDNLCYLELILKMFRDLPCDKIVIHTDPWQYDPVKYLETNYHYINHIADYNKHSRYQLIDLCQRLRHQYSDTLDIIPTIIHYEEFFTRIRAEKDPTGELEFIDLDPHPSPDLAYEFVKKYFLNNRQTDLIDSDFPVISDNYRTMVAKTMASSDPHSAHQKTCESWTSTQLDHYLNSSWLFATPEQRQQLMTGEVCKTLDWPAERIEDK